MAPRKQPQADLTGIRQRGNRYQVRIFGGTDPATGRQLILTRTCPWCADATVIGLSEEGMIRALTRHLEQCPGQQAQV